MKLQCAGFEPCTFELQVALFSDSLSMAALSHRKPASMGTCLDGYFAQGQDKRDTVQSSIDRHRTEVPTGKIKELNKSHYRPGQAQRVPGS